MGKIDVWGAHLRSTCSLLHGVPKMIPSSEISVSSHINHIWDVMKLGITDSTSAANSVPGEMKPSF